MLHFWSLLSIAVPPGIGCLAVRRDLLRELYRFREDYENRKLEDVENGKTGRLSPDKEGRRFSLLLCSAVLLSLGLNSLISMIPGGSVSSLNGELAGPAQLVSAALVYGLMMPLIEESVFRGLFPVWKGIRVQDCGLFSALLFGLYHGSWQQGCMLLSWESFLPVPMKRQEATGTLLHAWTLQSGCSVSGVDKDLRSDLYTGMGGGFTGGSCRRLYDRPQDRYR